VSPRVASERRPRRSHGLIDIRHADRILYLFRILPHRLTVVLTLVVLLLPIYWLTITSMSSPSDLISATRYSLLPSRLSLENFQFVMSDPHFGIYLRNSVVVATTVMVLSVSISTLGGYSLARLEFRGRRSIGRLVLFTYLAPPVLLAVPMFIGLSRLGLVNTPVGIVIAHMTFAVPFCVWLLRGFFLTIPRELADAAAIDGASEIQTLARIVLPLAKPGIVAAAMFAFLLSWNEYFYALIFLTDTKSQTLPIGLYMTYYGPNMLPSDWVHLMAGSVIASVPVVALFAFLQRWFVSGLTAGAVRG
jgi:multiple sugar transport system permease protein